MRKKWKKSKNRILVTMLAFLCLFSQFSTDVNAAVPMGTKVENFTYTFPVVYGNYSESTVVTSHKSFSLSMPSPAEVGYYYVLTIVGAPTFSTEWLYTRQEDTKQFVTANFIYKYGGVEYYGNSVYNTCFLFEGLNTSSYVLDIELETLLTPYTAGDGYIYANECQTTITWTPTVYLHRYEPEELPLAKQLVQIVNILNSLSNSPDINGSHSSLIINRLTDIMNDTSSIKSKLISLYDLLEEVYGQDEADKIIMDSFQQESSSQASQLGQLTEEGQVDKIDIDSASSTVDSNIDLDAVGSSGVVLSALTGHQKILTMLLGVTAISLIAYVFFGKR